MNPFNVKRLGVVMEPRPGDPRESGGVLNPGGVRGPDGEYYLFPRLVEAPNYSRIGIVRVIFEDGQPVGVERLGLALEPAAAFERNAQTAGCEDARVTYVPVLDLLFLRTSFLQGGPGHLRTASTGNASVRLSFHTRTVGWLTSTVQQQGCFLLP